MTLHLDAPDVRVYVDGRYEPHWRCVEAVLAGNGVLPRATFEVQPLGRFAGRLEVLDTQLAAFDQPAIEVVKGTQVVHWGKAVARPSSLDGEAQDQVQVISRMEPHHFGTSLYQTYFFDPRTRSAVSFPLPTVFNPEWDGKIVFNRSPQKHPIGGAFLMLHPGSIETDDGKAYHRAKSPLEWTLVDAVHYLCWTLNRVQAYVQNPTRGELAAALPGESGLLRNHVCPEGAYLPAQLDRLLKPFGCYWKVQFERGVRKLVFYQRGKGPPRMLKLQAPGEALNMARSNLERQNLTADVSSRSFNAIRIYGDYKRFEATFELVRGWSDDFDSRTPADLTKDAEVWRTEQQLEDVHRKWVLNESGDYNNLRPEIKRPFDFSEIFGANWLPRRRKFLACLTQKWDNCPVGLAHGVYLEWWDSKGGTDGTGAWVSIDELSSEGRQFRVLARECGIYFDGLTPPAELMSQGAAAKLRITACVESDQRAEVRIVRWPASLLKDLKEEHLQVGSRFKIHQRHKSSRFFGVPFTTSEIDDTPAMQAMANRLLDQWNLASLDGTATISGVDYIYRDMIGATIAGIDGRDVDFNIAPPGAAKRYPTVVGASINFIEQKVTLTLDTYREGI